MTKQKLWIILGLLAALILIVFSLNFYFVSHLNANQNGGGEGHGKMASTKAGYLHQLKKRVRSLKPIYLNRNPQYYRIRNKVWRNFETKTYENVSLIWDISYWWPSENDLFPALDTTMGQLLNALRNEEIISARNAPKGTQLKLLLTLSGKQKVIFKPKWYERGEVIDGPVYSGKDRFNAEIIAFYLAAILDMRWTPVAVGRKINLKEIYEHKADKLLRSTMTENEDQTKYCLYGKCFYCKESEDVCGDDEHLLEGVVLYLVPGSFERHRSPWQRTYKENQLAPWEENMDYCSSLKEKLSYTRILDLVDVAIFDFLIQNGDRHHYETREDRIVLIDNGKGFGNPNVDHIDILAPVYQCCVLRKSTWDRLLFFSGGTMIELLDQLSKRDLLYPLLTGEHYKAIERRLLMVYAAIETCFDRFDKETVLT
ncbi:glycosaminoglycan xylosylkinase homolog [Contarinia nasturtii]|uniref:glycosaminoglycan xylosylkinase homolog n=1 Tax=Contarinia nasturtii TaxID=265458 RepID=UPI0012D4367C|nr:glycosaminoglycan xylosylkinase homolog [Contarinia nasturtii]XP_031617547.1 glycosaminoglycan xylosylkinase homolog [Contarinia nasturtii]XP_031617548.1 glycosaminoglycan xylosylkinase homolog [Contarinia nasturtii]XP_031617549.1 glycosaminoglycan xylosylkinase homolog [Contarinia nasturtii]